MTYDEAERNYREVATELVGLRDGLLDFEEMLGKQEALLWMSPEVVQGSNEKARKALFEAARDRDEEYQNTKRGIRQRRKAIASLDIEERIARKRMDYIIANCEVQRVTPLPWPDRLEQSGYWTDLGPPPGPEEA